MVKRLVCDEPVPVTRRDALAQGHPFYRKETPCANGHVAIRHAKSGTCVACARAWEARKKKPGASDPGPRHFNAGTRAIAKALNLSRYSNGKTCQFGHVSERFVETGHCVTCSYARREKYRSPEKAKLYSKRFRERHPEQSAARSAAWKVANPDKVSAHNRCRRARKAKAEGVHTAKDVLRLHERQQGRCAGCQVKLRPGYHVDHVVPLSGGGSNGPGNLQLLCRFCNLSKGAKHPIDWARSKGLLL